MNEKQKELEELESQYFILNMKDIWDSSDHRFANELIKKIKKVKEEIKKNE